MTNSQSLESCYFDILSQSQIFNWPWDRRDSRGIGVSLRVLPSSTCKERKPYLDSRIKATRTSRWVEDRGAGRRRCSQNNQDRNDSALSSSGRPLILLKRKSRCICLDLWRHARYRQKYHRTTSKRRFEEEARLAKTTSIRPRVKQSHHRNSRQDLGNCGHNGESSPSFAMA